MSLNPAVSVLIPVYNGRDFLREAIESVLAEGGDTEVIVVDDGSTDGSLETVSGLKICVKRHAENRGIAAALNTGLALSSGRWITVLDADDRMAPQGLNWRVNYLKSHPEARAVAGIPAAIIDAKGKELKEQRHLLTKGYELPSQISLSQFRSGGMFPCLVWLFLMERALIEEADGFDESLRSAFDCDMIFRILESLDSIPVEARPVAFRRWHESNHSLAKDETGQRALQPTTQDEVRTVCRRYGIEATHFNLWENGYR